METAMHALQTFENVEQAEFAMLSMPQVDCPVVHYFAPGIAIRQVFLPAGALAVGHKQKFPHMNVMLTGKVVMLNDNGSTTTLSAPLTFVAQPGRKIGYVLEDVLWQNIYATELADAAAVEAHFIEKSDAWQEQAAVKLAEESLSRAADRQDYLDLLAQCGISHETARKQSENVDDQTRVPCASVMVSDSAIEGKGLFATVAFESGDLICPARLAGLRTQAGRYVNHSLTPNAMMIPLENGDIDLVALRDIAGCKGGELGAEITIDYRKALALSGIQFKAKEFLCQA